MTSRSSLRFFAFLAVFGFLADQATKYGVFRWLYSRPGHESDVVPGWFKFTAQYDEETAVDSGVWKSLQTWSAPVMPHVNKGALFGLGNDQKNSANTLFAVISLFAAIAILTWVTRSSAKNDRWLCLALGLILGGAVGNLYDRVVFSGVRDFLYFYKIEWPVFNVADCGLVVGTTVLVIHALFAKQPDSKPAPASEMPVGAVS